MTFMEIPQVIRQFDKMKNRKSLTENDATTIMKYDWRTLNSSISNLTISSASAAASNLPTMAITRTLSILKTTSSQRTALSRPEQDPIRFVWPIITNPGEINPSGQEQAFGLSKNLQCVEYNKMKQNDTPKAYRISCPKIFVSIVYLLSLCAVRSNAQESNASDPCVLEMYVYSAADKCGSIMNGIGKIIADGTCRTVEIDTTQNESDYLLFPGNYQAKCTSDGSRVRFIQSGCINQDCTSIVSGNDVCNRDNGSLSSLYARYAMPEYKVQLKTDIINRTADTSCHILIDGTMELAFHVAGDCTNPNCPRMETVPSPVRSPPSQLSSFQPSPQWSESSYQPTSQLRNDTAKITMALSFVANGTLSATVAAHIEETLMEHVKASAFNEGNKVKRIYFAEFKETTSGSLPSRRLLSQTTEVTGSKGNIVVEGVHEYVRYLYQWSSRDGKGATQDRRYLQQESSGTETLRIIFDFVVIFRMGTDNDLSAGEVMTNAFDTEAKHDAFKINLKAKNETLYKGIEKVEITSDETASPPNSINGINGGSQPNSDPGASNSTILVVGVACGSFVFLVVVGFFLYRRGQKDALSLAKNDHPNDGELSPSSTYLSSQQHQPQIQQSERWTNEIIIDPSNDDISTLGGSTLAELNMMRNGQRGVVDEDEHTASVNADYDYTRNRYRTGATHEDATIDDRSRGANTNYTNPTMYTTISKYGGPSLVADDDMSFDRQYDDDGDALDEDVMQNRRSQLQNTTDSFEVTNDGGILTTNNKITNTTNKYDGLKISPNVSMQNHASEPSLPVGSASPTDSTGTWLTKPFEIHVPPGVLGMVIDTPGGSTPVVRAIKNDSVLVGQVLIGDRLLLVDQIDVSKMPAMQVSNLISTRSHLNRILLFVRPIPSSVTTASDSQR